MGTDHVHQHNDKFIQTKIDNEKKPTLTHFLLRVTRIVILRYVMLRYVHVVVDFLLTLQK